MAGNLLKPDLSLVFCGYNPSLASGDTGRHYAHRSNRFWKVLYEAGITPRLYKPEEDEELLERGIGVYRLFLSIREVEWGSQAQSAVFGITDVVVPSPSGLNRMSLSELVEHYRPLTKFLS